MAPSASVADFRHVEIQKIGRTKRLLQPPGGHCNGIFEDKPSESAPVQRRVKDYRKSDIFGFCSDSSSSSLTSSPPSTPKLVEVNKTTKYRLFGPPEDTRKRKTQLEWLRSTLFAPEEPAANNKPRSRSARNPITGENCATFDVRTCQTPTRRIHDPITGEGINVKTIPRPRKQPPGGKTTLCLEYKE